MNAPQELSRRENIGMVAGDKFNHGYFARLSTPRPKCANAFQRCGERNHRACRERHADIPAYRGLIPDFEGCEERATTFAEKRSRRPIRWRSFYELIEFDNLASSSNLQSIVRSLKRRPLERLKIYECVDVYLRFRKEPCSAGEPCKSVFPFCDCIRTGGP